MKKKKGFTLIELLAVIVVLAIIALIATPIVTKIIDGAKKSVAIESANNLIRSAELYFVTNNPRYGKIDVLSSELNYKGNKPEKGEVEINNKGNSRIYTYIDGYCITKEYEGEPYASKTTKEECNWYTTDNYETSEGTTFTFNNQSIKDYKIYGNSIQETRSGKNLWNYRDLFEPGTTTYQASGITYSLTDEGVLVNGTADNYALSRLINIKKKLEVGKTYIISGGNNVVDVYIKRQVDGVASFPNKITVTGEEESIHVYLQVKPDKVVNNQLIKPQLEEGNTATAYEKYGKAPSSEFPSEIKNVGDLITSVNCSEYGSDACNNVGKYVIQVKASNETEEKITNIYLDEPLRKVGDTADYIDFNNKQVVRNVKVKDATGTKTIGESYSEQSPNNENIDLPSIDMLEGYNSITINTNVQPSNVVLTTNK